MTASDWNRELDVAMEALSAKVQMLPLGMPEWMQRQVAEQHRALPEYLRYREALEGLSRAIDLETPEKWKGKQMALFDATQYEDERYENPMVGRFGIGPDKLCKACKHFVHQGSYNRPWQTRYRKCEIRGLTHGEGTDHKASYHACSLFREDGEQT